MSGKWELGTPGGHDSGWQNGECVGQDLNLGTTKDQHLKLAPWVEGGESLAPLTMLGYPRFNAAYS